MTSSGQDKPAPPKGRTLMAGAVYFAIIFAIGFALGAVRIFVFEPSFGPALSVLFEIPIILACSWWVCARLIRVFKVASDTSARLVMGLVGFALLMGAELVLSVIGFQRTLLEHFASYHSLRGGLGLVGQLVFGAIPLLQLVFQAARRG
ncbi:MAG: hypothetical protein QNI84_09215 [Henriciella sp.]|nr:hypothetical protein [Henriciella sp.]